MFKLPEELQECLQGGITHGASYLLVDDEKTFFSLKRKLGFILGETS
jgi:reverse gyrase